MVEVKILGRLVTGKGNKGYFWDANKSCSECVYVYFNFSDFMGVFISETHPAMTL